MIMEPLSNLHEVGKDIADFGFLTIAAACYLVYSAVLLFFFLRWHMKTIDRHQKILDEMLSLEREQTRMLEKISGDVSTRSPSSHLDFARGFDLADKTEHSGIHTPY